MIVKFKSNRDSYIRKFAESYMRGQKILDIGCGEGGRTKLFLESCQVTGLDIFDYSAQVDECFTFIKGDALNLPFKAQIFDSVVSFDLIEHVEDDLKLCKEAFRVIRPGGYFVVGTPNRYRIANRALTLLGKRPSYPYELGPGIIHVREYLLSQLQNLLKKAGFEIDKSLAMWIGAAGLIDLGLKTFSPKFSFLSQYLLVIALKPGTK